MGAEEEQQKQQQPRGNEEGGFGTTTRSMSKSQFLSWKRQKDAVTSTRKTEAARKRADDLAAGTIPMNGRELFIDEPWVFDNTRY